MIFYPCKLSTPPQKVVNNATTTEPGYVLDGRMGHTLHQNILYYHNLAKDWILFKDSGYVNLDFNDMTTQGIYKCGGTNHNGGIKNAPHNADNGYLIVFCLDEGQGIRQVWVGLYAFCFMTRHYNRTTWSSWKSFSLS